MSSGWWWLTQSPDVLKWSPEERRARGIFALSAAAVWLPSALIVISVFDLAGLNAVLLTCALTLLPALAVARPIGTLLFADAVRAGDENAAKRLALRKGTDQSKPPA